MVAEPARITKTNLQYSVSLLLVLIGPSIITLYTLVFYFEEKKWFILRVHSVFVVVCVT